MLARRHVTVSLSGDGGDELFGGYARYFIGQRLFRWIARMPDATRPLAGRALTVLAPLFPARTAERVHKVARVLKKNDVDAMYFELVSHWPGSDAAPVLDRAQWPRLDDPVERMMYFDLISYLPDDILTKVDRASMAVSLEAREPLLDYRLVEFAWTLPLSMKVRNGVGKQILRRVLDRYVPASLIDRPKMGFGIPLETLLRGRLRDWAESLLKEVQFVDARAKWRDHLGGNDQWKHYLWGVLMLQAWLNVGRVL
jgi:asparagine synthase (glutamine-hydrolysing)